MSESTPPRSRWSQFGLWTLFVVVTVVAFFAVFAIYATKVESRETTFSAKDIAILRTAIGVPLPTGAVFRQAALVGRRDKTITVELRMPVADAKQLAAIVSPLSNNRSSYDAGYATRSYYSVYHIPPDAEIESYYWIGEESQFIFWKSRDPIAIVTIDFVGERKITEAKGVFGWW